MANPITGLIKKDLARSEQNYRKFLRNQKAGKQPGQIKTALRAPDTLVRESAKEAAGMAKAGYGAVKKAGQSVSKATGGVRKRIGDVRKRLKSNVRVFDPKEGRQPGKSAVAKQPATKPAAGIRSKRAPAAKPTIASTKKNQTTRSRPKRAGS